MDLPRATWVVPAGRAKTGREHRVPLSGRSLGVLDEAKELRDQSHLVFPSVRGKSISDNTLSKLFRELEIPGVPHGLRSSFRDWCAETGGDRDAAEACLAHSLGPVESAYARSDLFRAPAGAHGTVGAVSRGRKRRYRDRAIAPCNVMLARLLLPRPQFLRSRIQAADRLALVRSAETRQRRRRASAVVSPFGPANPVRRDSVGWAGRFFPGFVALPRAQRRRRRGKQLPNGYRQRPKARGDIRRGWRAVTAAGAGCVPSA